MKYTKHLVALGLASSLCASGSAAFVINEFDSDTPGADRDEFIELKGNPNESADGLVLVFFDGSDGSISFDPGWDLTGLTADENGYLLIASDNFPDADLTLPDAFIRNANEAVALYRDSASNWPAGSSPTTNNLVDAVVYRAIGTEQNDWSGLGNLPVYDEGLYGNVANFSLSRLPDGTGTEFLPTEPTPGYANVQQSDFTVSDIFLPRYNQTTALEPTSVTVTIRNAASKPLTITSVDLASTSSDVFSLIAPETLPITLTYNQTTTYGVELNITDVSSNQVFSGAVNIANNSVSSPSLSIGFGTELVRATQTAAIGDVKVNEVCYTGNFDHNNDGTLVGQNDEFVELVNMTNAPIVIEGWEQRCTDNDSPSFHSFVFPAGATIPANGFVTVFTSGEPTGFAPGTAFTYGIARIRNNGSFIGINDGTKLIDGVAFQLAEDTPDADAYKNVGVLATGGDTFGRRPDGSDTFRVFDTADAVEADRPTPNASNNGDSSVSDWALF